MNWKWLQIVARKQRGCFCTTRGSLPQAGRGLKGAIKELSNGIGNVSSPLKWLKKHLLCIFPSPASRLSEKLFFFRCAPNFFSPLTFLSLKLGCIKTSALSSRAELRSGIISPAPRVGDLITVFMPSLKCRADWVTVLTVFKSRLFKVTPWLFLRGWAVFWLSGLCTFWDCGEQHERQAAKRIMGNSA